MKHYPKCCCIMIRKLDLHEVELDLSYFICLFKCKIYYKASYVLLNFVGCKLCFDLVVSFHILMMLFTFAETAVGEKLFEVSVCCVLSG
jgi:hypothetical protein